MDPVLDVMKLLLGDNTVFGLVDTRIFPLQVPEESERPCIRVYRVSEIPYYSADGAIDGNSASLVVDAIARDYKEAREIDQAIRDVLGGYRGEGQTSYMASILIDDVMDAYWEVSDSYVASLTLDLQFRSKAQ